VTVDGVSRQIRVKVANCGCPLRAGGDIETSKIAAQPASEERVARAQRIWDESRALRPPGSRGSQPDAGAGTLIPVTNAIESLNAKLRRAVRTRGHFPHDDAVMKLLYLVLNLAEKDWRMPPREWTMAKTQFAILFEDRFKLA